MFNPTLGLFMMTGMRVNPNTDMIGGHAVLGRRGVARTLRLGREWRKHCDTQIGPLRYDFVEPFRDVHLSLVENPSGLTFDLHEDETGRQIKLNDGFGIAFEGGFDDGWDRSRKLFGVEHIANITLRGPDGTVETGMAQIEVFLNGRYEPYGFANPTTMAGHGLVGGRIV